MQYFFVTSYNTGTCEECPDFFSSIYIFSIIFLCDENGIAGKYFLLKNLASFNSLFNDSLSLEILTS